MIDLTEENNAEETLLITDDNKELAKYFTFTRDKSGNNHFKYNHCLRTFIGSIFIIGQVVVVYC